MSDSPSSAFPTHGHPAQVFAGQVATVILGSVAHAAAMSLDDEPVSMASTLTISLGDGTEGKSDPASWDDLGKPAQPGPVLQRMVKEAALDLLANVVDGANKRADELDRAAEDPLAATAVPKPTLISDPHQY